MNDSDKRPYGFPPALWIALGKNSTVVTQAERVDPLCKWVIHGIAPDNALDFQKVKGACGGTDWRVNDFSSSYKKSVAEQFQAMPNTAEIQRVHERFTNAAYYSSRGYKNMRSRRRCRPNGTEITSVNTENEMQDMSTST